VRVQLGIAFIRGGSVSLIQTRNGTIYVLSGNEARWKIIMLD